MLPSQPRRRSPRRLRTIAMAALATATFATPATAFAADKPTFVIAVLGDSYASGEGSPDEPGNLGAGCGNAGCRTEKWWSPDSWFPDRKAVFPQQDDLGWQQATKRCHRSSKAPGPHAAMLLAEKFRDVRIEVLDFACGGAEIGAGVVRGAPGAEPPSFSAPDLPSQLSALREYAATTHREIDATVVNIGGNDGRFGQLVTECL